MIREPLATLVLVLVLIEIGCDGNPRTVPELSPDRGAMPTRQPAPKDSLNREAVFYHSRLPVASNIGDAPLNTESYMPSVDGSYDIRDLLYYRAEHHDFVDYIENWHEEEEAAGNAAGKWSAPATSSPFPRESGPILKSDQDCRAVTVAFVMQPPGNWEIFSRLTSAKAILMCNPSAERALGKEFRFDPDWRDDDQANALERLLTLPICRQIELLQLPCGDNITTNETLVHVGQLAQLRGLSLWNVNITDDGLAHLVPLQRMLVLNLDGCEIGDEGLRHVGKLRALRSLSLNGRLALIFCTTSDERRGMCTSGENFRRISRLRRTFPFAVTPVTAAGSSRQGHRPA